MGRLTGQGLFICTVRIDCFTYRCARLVLRVTFFNTGCCAFFFYIICINYEGKCVSNDIRCEFVKKKKSPEFFPMEIAII